MPSLDLKHVTDYVENNIGEFHEKRIEKLKSLKLTDVLKRKNPYLFKAKNILTAQELVETILDAYLSSQEETIFGEFLEGLAVFICGKVYHGKKSSAEGIDLEFEKDNIHYLVTIKSGPNWGNSGQIKKMLDNFKKAKKILGTNVSARKKVVAVNACCYGKDNAFDKGEYLKLCGQRFWEFISGNENLYTDIIGPLGHKAKEKNEEFLKSRAAIINEFTFTMLKQFCANGQIDWKKLVNFNSARQ